MKTIAQITSEPAQCPTCGIMSKPTIRQKMIDILIHRVRSLEKTKPFPERQKKIAEAVYLRDLYIQRSKIKEDFLNQKIRHESVQLLALYGPKTRFQKEREELVTIVNNAYYAGVPS